MRNEILCGDVIEQLAMLSAARLGVGIELNPAYVAMAEKRIQPYRQRLL